MKIWLLRHADAEDRAPSGRDEDRRLTAKGRSDCHELHARIRDCGLELPSEVRVSPAQRAQETARTVLAHLPFPAPTSDPRLWNASVGDLVEIIDEAADQTRGLMLIAHNPGLEGVIRWLGGQLPAPGMKAGTLVVLEIDRPPAPGTARTAVVHQPKESM
jgi:phosphohistidine phosphatase